MQMSLKFQQEAGHYTKRPSIIIAVPSTATTVTNILAVVITILSQGNIRVKSRRRKCVRRWW